MSVVANFIRLSELQIENRLRSDKVTVSLRAGTFLRHSVCSVVCSLHAITITDINLQQRKGSGLTRRQCSGKQL